MTKRKFGVTLLSTPKYYLFSEEEIRKVYYNLIKHIKYKYGNSDYDYSILVGLSNIDSKTVLEKIKTNGVGRTKYIFMPINKKKGVRYTNWHLHIMICGAPLGTMVKDIEDYLQKILNKKLVNEEFDKSVYDTPNFKKFYCKAYRREIDLLLSGLGRPKRKREERTPKCILTNLNINRRKTANTKRDYEEVIQYIMKQSILHQTIESKGFTIAYFDVAKKLGLLAKPGRRFWRKR